MWEHAAALAWWARAQEGQIATPYRINDHAANALLWAVRHVREGTLIIDTADGGSTVWNVAHELALQGRWDALIGRHAMSAGLILTVACNGTRACIPTAKFLFHGLDIRDHEAEDTRRAEWFAKRTSMPASFWREHCGEDFSFGADEALEFGVVHEILSGAE